MADDQLQASSAAQWPDVSLWPDDDAPPRTWAAFYRDHLREIVLPMPGPMDIFSHAAALARRAVVAHMEIHGVEPDEDTAVLFWDEAREEAERWAKAPIGYIRNAALQKVAVSSDVTDEMLDLWFVPLEHSRGPRCEADRRGICIVPRRHCLVDVDPRHGGEVDGEWGMVLAGPKASTPGGGVHTLVLSTGKEVAGADVPKGVDVVAAGGTPIPLPAGSATPGRRWLRKDAPVVGPDELRRRGRRKFQRKEQSAEAGPNNAGQHDLGDDEEPGRAAQIVASDVGDGERNATAPVIVGVLARPFACPADFVRACLELLAEDGACRGASSAEIRDEMDRWQGLLTRGPRDAHFAGEVLETWLRVRAAGVRPMRTPPRKFAASVWKVCDRREGGEAGAEDLGVGPRLGVAAAEMGDATTRLVEMVPPAPAIDHPVPAPTLDPPPPFPPPTPEQAEAAALASKVVSATWRGGIDPRTYAFSLGEDYTDADLQRDLRRRPVDIAAVCPVVDFASGLPTTSPDLLVPPMRMGWGAALAAAKRGISAGEFLAVGASSAGAGKTTFLAWLVNGLAIQTAYRLLKVDGYEKRPIVFPVWVTEMPKKMELYGRLLSAYLGFDRGCLEAGEGAEEAPGVLAMASRLNMTAREVVAQARAMERAHGNDERFPLAIARHRVIKKVKPSKLIRQSRRDGVTINHRTGPDLVDHVADAVQVFREDLAQLAGVSCDEVLPVVIFDPVQRFAGESEKAAIDAILTAANEVLCEELECCVVTTNDTTKKAAGGVTLDHFLSAESPGLMADIFSGSQGIIHHASDVIVVHPERPDPSRPNVVRQWVRMPRSRGGGESFEVYPFEWDKSLGRLTPGGPEPLRDPPEQPGQQRRSGASSASAVDHMAGYPEIGTVLVTIPFGDDANRLALKSVGATFDRTSKSWAVEASRARLRVEAERLAWKRPPPLAVAQVLPPPKLSGAERYVDD